RPLQRAPRRPAQSPGEIQHRCADRPRRERDQARLRTRRYDGEHESRRRQGAGSRCCENGAYSRQTPAGFKRGIRSADFADTFDLRLPVGCRPACQAAFLRLAKPKPKRPAPSKVNDAGSGALAVTISEPLLAVAFHVSALQTQVHTLSTFFRVQCLVPAYAVIMVPVGKSKSVVNCGSVVAPKVTEPKFAE